MLAKYALGVGGLRELIYSTAGFNAPACYTPASVPKWDFMEIRLTFTRRVNYTPMKLYLSQPECHAI